MAHTLLYGGTFDPIHHGHLIACQRAREILAADRVVFIPARVSPHKTEAQTGASGVQRAAMIELAIAGTPAFAMDGRELVREGPSYTIDTLEAMRREAAGEKFTLLIGEDQLPKLHTWHRVKELLELVEVGILLRGDAGGGRVVWSGVAEGLGKGVDQRLAKSVLQTPRVDISSTEVRERARRGLPIDFLVPAGVAAYIREQGLYRG